LDERGLSYLIRYYGYLDVKYSDICLKLHENPFSVATVIVGLIFIFDTELFFVGGVV